MGLIIVIALIVIVVAVYISMYNGLQRAKVNTDESWSQIDVQLKRRNDLIPNLVETTKGYAKHERETLSKVVELRNQMVALPADVDPQKKMELSNQLTDSLKSIFALAENYPDLKASANFQDLSRELSKVEEDIANARKYYNGAVEMFNNKVEMFPSNILAKLFGYKPKAMFETDSNERENVKVSF